MAISNLNLGRFEFAAVVKPVNAELGGGGTCCALVKPEGGRVAAFGEACGTGVYDKHSLEVLFDFPNMRMPVEVGVDLAAAVF